VLLTPGAVQTLGVIMDGSVGGRGGGAVMLHVVDKGRALPLAGQVRQGTKGHLPESLPIAVVEQGHAGLPRGAAVVRLGDGACEGTGLQHTLADAGGSEVCRTGGQRTASWQGETWRLEALGTWSKPGTLVARSAVRFTAAAYGPRRLLWGGAQGAKAPRYLVTHMTVAAEAWRVEATRFRIAPFFSDQQSRGCHLHPSHIADAKRLSRLLSAAWLASIGIVYRGSSCLQDGGGESRHRRHRCALSLCQLGLRVLDHFLHEDFPIPVAFHIVHERSKKCPVVNF
jgi:hypothetical protein